MIFTHLCRAVAVLGMIYSAIVLLAGYRLAEYAPSQSQLDFKHGLTALLAAIVLGTLAEISFSFARTS